MKNVKVAAQSVKLRNITPDALNVITEIARVSSNRKDILADSEKLIRYLLKHGHYSPFEHASATFQIITSRAISAQILRHSSIRPMEFSQRYSEVQEIILPEFRKEHKTNRQSSSESFSKANEERLNAYFLKQIERTFELYNAMIKEGVARECARNILPLCTKTKIYMTGSIRSWITYLDIRLREETQLEHREIALEIMKILEQQLGLKNFFKKEGNFLK